MRQRIVDGLFRQVVVERFGLICNLAPSPGRWTVLDVGCGSGRYAIALAAAGAARVVGVDVAQAMVDLAHDGAARAHVEGRCEFVTTEFLEFARGERFDVVVATGYFDYLSEPLPHLKKMLAMCSGKVFASFPKRWDVRVPLRKARIGLSGGFVRFYSAREIVRLVMRAGLPRERISMIDVGRDRIVIMRVG